MPVFSFAPEVEDLEEPLVMDDENTQVKAEIKEDKSAPEPEKEEKPKKKRFHKNKESKEKVQEESQLSIFDSVPFGNV